MSPLITKDRKALEQTQKKELSILKQPWKLLRTEPLKTEMPKNRPKLKKLTSEWILQRPKQNRTERHQRRTE